MCIDQHCFLKIFVQFYIFIWNIQIFYVLSHDIKYNFLVRGKVEQVGKPLLCATISYYYFWFIERLHWAGHVARGFYTFSHLNLMMALFMQVLLFPS